VQRTFSENLDRHLGYSERSEKEPKPTRKTLGVRGKARSVNARQSGSNAAVVVAIDLYGQVKQPARNVYDPCDAHSTRDRQDQILSPSLGDIERLFNLFFQGNLTPVGDEPSPCETPAPSLDELLKGKPVCENCGKSDCVRKREDYTTQREETREYFSCDRCGRRVHTNITGRRHTVNVVAKVLSRFFNRESTRDIKTGMLEE